MSKLNKTREAAILCAVLGSFAAHGQTLTPDKLEKARAPIPRDGIVYRPTKRGFIVKPKTLPPLSIRRGTLLCDGAGDSCVVYGMPLFSQSDPGAAQSFESWLGQLNAPGCTVTGPMCYVQLAAQSATPGAAATYQKQCTSTSACSAAIAASFEEWGCYNASITTLQITALANRSSSRMPLSGRTLAFNSIPATNRGYSVSQPLNQYAFALEQQALAQVPYTCGTIAETECQPYYLFETVADLSNQIAPGCDPYNYAGTGQSTKDQSLSPCVDFEQPIVGTATPVAPLPLWNQKPSTPPKSQSGVKVPIPKPVPAPAQPQPATTAQAFRMWSPGADTVSNDQIKSRLQDGWFVLLGFLRYQPVISWDGTTLTVVFDPAVTTGMHKVPVSGFQTGAYPVRINDVGDGEVADVRFTADPSTLNFCSQATAALPSQCSQNLPANQVVFTNKGSDRVILVYEGHEDGSREVDFVDNFDGIWVLSH